MSWELTATVAAGAPATLRNGTFYTCSYLTPTCVSETACEILCMRFDTYLLFGAQNVLRYQILGALTH